MPTMDKGKVQAAGCPAAAVRQGVATESPPACTSLSAAQGGNGWSLWADTPAFLPEPQHGQESILQPVYLKSR